MPSVHRHPRPMIPKDVCPHHHVQSPHRTLATVTVWACGGRRASSKLRIGIYWGKRVRRWAVLLLVHEITVKFMNGHSE